MSVELKSIELPSGERLGYREREGGDETVLLIHGNMNSSAHWDIVLEQMDAKYKIYAVDMRGFGISTYHEPAARIEMYTDDVNAFMDLLGLSSCIVWGWSTGGGVSMDLAARYPQRVSKLVLLASMSTRGYPFYEDGPDGMPDVTKRIVSADGIRKSARNQWVQKANEERDKTSMRTLFNSVIYDRNQPDEARYEAYLEDILTQRNLMDIYEALNTFNISHMDHEAAAGSGLVDRIQVPALVLRGERDMVITEQMHRELLDDFGGRAHEVILTGCGHSPLVDDSRQLLAAVEKFLQGGTEA